MSREPFCRMFRSPTDSALPWARVPPPQLRFSSAMSAPSEVS